MKAFMSALLLFSTAAFSDVTFKTKEIKVGTKTLEAEIADTDPLREKGLMNREKLKDDHGMVFVFPTERRLSFWMKNTLIPLSIGFFTSEGKLVQIIDMDPASPMELQPKVYVSARPAKYALEVNKGWFKKYKVELGSKLSPLKF